jgi:hypothetical protein
MQGVLLPSFLLLLNTEFYTNISQMSCEVPKTCLVILFLFKLTELCARALLIYPTCYHVPAYNPSCGKRSVLDILVCILS